MSNTVEERVASLWVPLGALALLFSVSMLLLYQLTLPDSHLIVGNEATSPITDIELILTKSSDGGLILKRTWDRLAPGKTVKLESPPQTFHATIAYTVGGQRQLFKTEGLDLSWSSSWIYEVQPDHSLHEGFKSESEKLDPAQLATR